MPYPAGEEHAALVISTASAYALRFSSTVAMQITSSGVSVAKRKGTEMNQKELNAVLDQHELWLRSGGRKGKRADLCGENLKRLSFVARDLEGIDLVGADCHCADFYGANLVNADMRFGNFQHADLRCTFLAGSDRRGADFYSAQVDEWVEV